MPMSDCFDASQKYVDLNTNPQSAARAALNYFGIETIHFISQQNIAKIN